MTSELGTQAGDGDSAEPLDRSAGRLRELRVAHVTDSFAPNIGGLEISIGALARLQSAQGRSVAVVTARHPDAPDAEVVDGVEIRRLPMALGYLPGAHASSTHLFFPPVSDLLFARRFTEFLDGWRPDVIHVRGWVLYSVLGPATRAGIPVIASAHDHSQVCAVKVMLDHGRRVCSGPELRKCMSCARDHYGPKGVPLAAGLYELGSRRHPEVALWTATSTELAKRGSAPRMVDRTAVRVIPTFIADDVIDLAADERTASRPGFVPQVGPYIFYAGALGTHKGVDILLEAYARLRDEGVRIPLVLAGLPREDYAIADTEGVVVAANVAHRDVVAACRHASVGVAPSVIPEGFGRTAVEFLAAGTPCVVSALGGLLDIVTHEVDGLHVQPSSVDELTNAIRRLLDDDDLRRRLGAAGPAKAATFRLSRVAAQVDSAYLEVLENEAREIKKDR